MTCLSLAAIAAAPAGSTADASEKEGRED